MRLASLVLLFLLVLSQAGAEPPHLATGRPGVTPLMMAAFSGSDARLDELLRVGAVDAQAADGMTALLFAAMRGTVAGVTRLLDAGASLATRNRNGMTALLLAAEYNADPAVTALLLERGASVNDRDVRGRTPLMAAAGRNNADVVETLLAAGADPKAVDLKNRTAAAYAQFGNVKLTGTTTFWTLYERQYR